MLKKKRDIGKEILEGVRAIKEGKGKRFKVELPLGSQRYMKIPSPSGRWKG